MSEIKAEGLRHVYSEGTPFEKVAIDNINVTIPHGQLVGIIGHTGSGKSTFIQHLNGLLKPSAGTIYCDGQDINETKKITHDVRFKVGLVFQYPEYQLFEETVAKDIAFGPTNMGLSKAEVEARVEEAAKITGIDGSVLSKSPFELSGGQRRLCAIAGILAMEPRILVLDEPNAGLDPHGRAEVRRILAEVKGAGVTVVQVTHSMEDAATCDEVVVLNQSRLLMHLTPDEVFSPENEPLLRESGLGLPAPLRFALALEQDGAEPLGDPLTEDELVSAITGRAATSGEVG